MTPARLLASLIVLPILAAFGLAGTETDLEELVRQQGEQIRHLKEEVERLRSQRSPGLDEAVESYLEVTPSIAGEPQKGRRVRLGGYFSVEWRDDGEGRSNFFDAHRVVPRIFADVAPGIYFETEIEIEGGGADAAFLTRNEILIEYAELQFEIIEDLFSFAAGVILMPWGRFNQYHDDPLNDLTDRPLVSRFIGTVAFGQPGIAGAGSAHLGGGWFLDYKVALVQGYADGITTNGGNRGARQSFRADNNNNKQLFGRIVLTPPWKWVDVVELGASGTYGKYDDAGDHEVYGYGLELFFKRGPWQLIAEWMDSRYQRDPSAPPGDPRRQTGWYVEAAFHFFPKSWRGAHTLLTEESTFTLVVRVEAIDLNHATTGSTFRDDLRQVSLGFNFRPYEKTVFKMSYTFVESKESGFDSGSANRFVVSWATYF
ncbi:MAG: porin family protein [Planctomycetota bacterium]